MKKLFVIIAAFIPVVLQATVHTVSNTPSTLAQFNTIQAAVNAAAVSGDTIYVHGSPNVYGAFSQTNKQITFMGPGWSPDKNLPFVAVIAGCTITGTACSGSEYQGLVFNSTIAINSSKPDDLRFIRNHFSNLSLQLVQGGTTYLGYLFDGNLFDNSGVDATSGSTYQNFLFQNNYFFENACCRDGNIAGFFNSINVLFDHNLWFGTGSTNRNAFSSNNRFLLITNNVFVRRDAANANSNSTFNNNITFYPSGTVLTAPWTLNGNVNAGGNIDNQDPQMTAQTAVNNGSNNPLNDFTIATGPANNAGSDGKDIGLLYDASGSLNWTNSRNSRLPRIFAMNITTPTIPAGGNVTVNVDARISN